MDAASGDTRLFIPDFGAVRNLFLLVLGAELLAFVLVLATTSRNDFWQLLSLISLYVQWVALASAAGIYLVRPLLKGRGNLAAAISSYLLILLIAGLVSGFGHALLEPSEDPRARVEFVLRSLAVTAIVAAVVLHYLYLQHEWKRRVESESTARVEALQARIRPHFLFNSLNTIASMISYSPAEAEAAVEDLADLFRASLAHADRLVPLRDELELARGYLKLESLRLGDRLQVVWDVAELPGDALVPPLSLQPLLENAVYHGIEPLVSGGVIRIEGRRQEELLHILVSNPLPAGQTAPRAGMGMAQENVRERLVLALGRQSRLQGTVADDDYRVEVILPYRSEPYESAYR